ncbi:MAG: Na/Pi cotransporter family protein [Candidatus Coproplasma sp.]
MSISAVLTIINNLFFVLGGVAVFMIGMEMMGSNLEKAAGRNIRSLMSKAAKNRFTGIGTGAVVTALVNSSSATTVMIVGFVNVGLMTLSQAASIIMGANIGTTVSAFIMALSSGGAELEVSAVFALIAFCGLMMNMICKNDKIKRVGNILSGIGMIFVGLHVMSAAVGDLTAEDSEVRGAIVNLFTSLGNGAENLTWEVFVLFLIGMVLTALMQSSAAITAIVISLASSGLMSLQMAMCVVLGTNVGTCFTSVLSSIGTNTNAKRAACVHLLFNILGCVIFIVPVAIWGGNIAAWLTSFIPSTQWQIAIFHMFFNVITTLILMWFIKYLVKLACIIVPDKSHAAEESSTEILDVRLLKTPAIAVGQARKEIVKMSQIAFSNYKRALDMLLSYDVSQKEEFETTEKQIDGLNKYITQFLVKLSSQEISEIDERKVSSFYHVTSDIERIGDYAENIMEYADEMLKTNARFSPHAVEEIREMDLHLTELYKNVELAFANHDLSYEQNIEAAERETDAMCIKMKDAHIRRTNEGRCSPEAGSVYLQLAINMERIGDHMHNISNSIKTYVSSNN